MSEMNKKVRLGKKEKAILNFLKEKGGSVWKSEILDRFSKTYKYDMVLNKRLENLAKKGLIEIKYEVNPQTGREKQRVYLKQ